MGSKAAVLVVDLDHFKQVNDTLGHHAGDLLLQNVSAIFSTAFGDRNRGRATGGDEFSLNLEEPTNRTNARLVRSILMQLLQEPMQVGEHLVQVGASIGVAVYPDDATDSKHYALRPTCACTMTRIFPANIRKCRFRQPVPP